VDSHQDVYGLAFLAAAIEYDGSGELAAVPSDARQQLSARDLEHLRVLRLLYGESSPQRRVLEYRNIWFAWELLRRSPKHWRRLAWWDPAFSGDVSPTQEAFIRLWTEIDEGLSRQFLDSYETFPTRSFSFPEPDDDGQRPATRAGDFADPRVMERDLWMLLGRYARTPILLEPLPSNLGASAATASDGPIVACRLDLGAHPDDLVEAFTQLRRARGISSPPSRASRDLWGRSITAPQAIKFLEHVEHGGSLYEWAEEHAQRRGMSHETAEDVGRELGRRILASLRHDPLAPIRGTSTAID
jgi:hypothetical protein